MIRRSTASITTLWTEPQRAPGLRIVLLTAFYLAVFADLVVLYGRGNFRAPPFRIPGFLRRAVSQCMCAIGSHRPATVLRIASLTEAKAGPSPTRSSGLDGFCVWFRRLPASFRSSPKCSRAHCAQTSEFRTSHLHSSLVALRLKRTAPDAHQQSSRGGRPHQAAVVGRWSRLQLRLPGTFSPFAIPFAKKYPCHP